MNKKSITRRHFFICLLLSICFIEVIIKLFELSVFERKFLSSQAQAQSTRIKIIKGSRGDLLDRNGLPLAISVQYLT